MIFNPWRKYPKRSPKESGHYLCTVGVWDGDEYKLTIAKLYFMVRDGKGKWFDPNRQSVFDGYKVYNACRAPIEENRVWTDSLCERTDNVIAWKKLPKCWRPRCSKKGR